MSNYRKLVFFLFFVSIGLSISVAIDGDINQERDTFTCEWAEGETLHLISWRGKVAIRRYTFENVDTKLRYPKVRRSAYRQCVRHAGKIDPADMAKLESQNRRSAMAGLSFIIALLGVFFLPVYEEMEISRQEAKEKKVERARQAKWREEEERAIKRRAVELEARKAQAESDRVRSKKAHEERLERKARKRAEHEARRKANEARKAAHVAKWEANHGR